MRLSSERVSSSDRLDASALDSHRSFAGAGRIACELAADEKAPLFPLPAGAATIQNRPASPPDEVRSTPQVIAL